MLEILQFLLSTPLPTLLVIGGFVFLFISIGEVTQIKVSRERKKTAAKWGATMLFAGIFLFVAPPITEALTPTPTPATDLPAAVAPTSISPPAFTDGPAAIFTSPPAISAVSTAAQTITGSPTQSCDQLRVEDFKLTSPAGTHGAETDGANVPQLKEHMPVTWEPFYCPLTIKVFRGGVPVRTYDSAKSGEITTDFIMKDYPNFVRGDWIEIKVWIPEASLPSDNVHIKLPYPS